MGKVELVCLVTLIICLTSLEQCRTTVSWQSFVTSSNCVNFTLVVPGNVFQPQLIPKGTWLLSARVHCARSCTIQDNCYGFNFCEDSNGYVCELLSDNFTRNHTLLQLLEHPGCSVWEKRNTLMAVPSDIMSPESSTSIKPPYAGMSTNTSDGTTSSNTLTTPTLCEVVRPGCLGIFPNCYNCTKTCIDWKNRADLKTRSLLQVTLWPDGDGPDSQPTFTECVLSNVVLIDKYINPNTGTLVQNFVMPFPDMHRLIKLHVYPYISFNFVTRYANMSSHPSPNDLAKYRNVFIGPDGTLANLTYSSLNTSMEVDIFNLGGKAMPPTPFVNVTDDRYNCGSFWLLNPTNATYCPGGRLGMFGSLASNGTHIVKTGIRVPSKPNAYTYSVTVLLRLN